jgi:hypothetical protein
MLVLNWSIILFSFFFFPHTNYNRTASSYLQFLVCSATVGLAFLLLPLFCCFGPQFTSVLRSGFGRFAACLLVLWQQATAVLSRLPMAEVPLGLAADLALLAYQDSLAMGVAAIGAVVQSR